MLSTQLILGFAGGCFLMGFSTKIVYAVIAPSPPHTQSFLSHTIPYSDNTIKYVMKFLVV
jgi:hypothetical protein